MVKSIDIRISTKFLAIALVVLMSNFISVCSAEEISAADVCEEKDLLEARVGVYSVDEYSTEHNLNEPPIPIGVCMPDAFNATLWKLRNPTREALLKSHNIFDFKKHGELAFQLDLVDDYYGGMERLKKKLKADLLDAEIPLEMKSLKLQAMELDMLNDYTVRYEQIQQPTIDKITEVDTVVNLRELKEFAEKYELMDIYEARIVELQAPVSEELGNIKTLAEAAKFEDRAEDFGLTDKLNKMIEEIRKRKSASKAAEENILSFAMEDQAIASLMVKNAKKNTDPEGEPSIHSGSTKLLVSAALVNQYGVNKNVAATGKVIVKNNKSKTAKRFAVKESDSPIVVAPDSSCLKPIAAGGVCEFDIKYTGKSGRLLRSSIDFEVLGEEGKSDKIVIDVVDLPASVFFDRLCFDKDEVIRSVSAGSVYAIDTASNGVLIHAGTNRGVFRYEYKTGIWYRVGLEDVQVHDLKSVFTKNSFVLYAATYGIGILKSTDEGKSWVQMNSGLEGTDVRTLLVSSNDSDSVLYAGTRRGVFRSSDGKNWKKINNGLKNVSVRSLYSAIADGVNIVYVGTDDGVYMIRHSEENWEPIDLIDSNVCSIRSEGLWKAHERNISLATDRNRKKFLSKQPVYFPASMDEFWTTMQIESAPICPAHLREMWRPTNLDNYGVCALRSEEVWKNSTLADSFMRAIPVVPMESMLEYFGVTKSNISYSDLDNGVNWGEADLSNIPVCSMHYMDGALYAGTMGAGVFKNSFDGKGWKKAGLDNKFVCSLVSESGILYAGIYGAGIVKTLDGGETWSNVSENLPNNHILSLRTIKSDAGIYLYVGTDNGVIFKNKVVDKTNPFT